MTTSPRVALSAALALGVLVSPTRATACRCRAMTPQEAAAEASEIFEGRVLEVARADDGAAPTVVTLALVRTWKGFESQERISVNTQRDPVSCGFPFEVGQSYLVYGRDADGAVWVDACSQTRLIAEAQDHLRALGMGQTPVDPKADPLPEEKDEPPARGGCASCAVGAGAPTGRLAFTALGLLAAIGLRRRARR